MICHGDTAIGTVNRSAAVTAAYNCMIPSAVKQKYCLLLIFQILVYLINKNTAKFRGITVFPFFTHINYPHLGKLISGISLFHFKKPVYTLMCIIIAFYRRCSRGEKQNCIMPSAAFFCNVNSVIARRAVRLIRTLPLLVNYYYTDIFKGSKDCASCAHGNFSESSFYTLVFVHSLSQGQPAVKHCYFISEQRLKSPYNLRSKRYFRNQKNSLFSGTDTAEYQFFEHCGFSASCNTVQKKTLRLSFCHTRINTVENFLLTFSKYRIRNRTLFR